MGYWSAIEAGMEFRGQKQSAACRKVSDMHFALLFEDDNDCLSEY